MTDDVIIFAPYVPVHLPEGQERPDPIELDEVVELGGHLFVPTGSWEEARITIDPNAHEARVDPCGLVVEFWGLHPLNRRRKMYPDLPEGTDMFGVRTNPPCSELGVDPNWTKEKGHGDYMARECCITVYGLVIALPDGALP